MRNRRRPGPVGIRIRRIKLFEPTIHAPTVMQRKLRVHADLRILARTLPDPAPRIAGRPVGAIEVN